MSEASPTEVPYDDPSDGGRPNVETPGVREPELNTPFLRVFALGLAVLAVRMTFHLHGHDDYGRTASWVFLLGLAFGWVMQRARFCFFCMLRDLFEGKDSRAALAMILALIVGVTAHTVLFTAWIRNPLAGHLPPRAFIGPVSWAVALGGFAFGAGMSMSGSCISAHLYRLGEGSLLAPISILGAFLGAMLGLKFWNPLYLRVLQDAPIVWLPSWKGYTVAWAIVAVALGLIAWGLLRWVPAPDPGQTRQRPTAMGILHAVFTRRWPAWVGGLIVGLLSTAALFRGQPLGVTAELNRLARVAGDALKFLPERLEGVDTFRGCRIMGDDPALSMNALFVIAIVVGGLIGAAGTGVISPSQPKLKAYPLALLGGILLGWGAYIALGCTIGTLLSGTHAGAAAGWIFAITMIIGVRAALPLRWWAER